MSTTTTTQTTQTQGIFRSTLDTTNQASSVPIPRGPTTSQLVFYAPPVDGATPFNYVESPPEGQPQRNYTEEAKEVQIHDIRGRESEYNLDTHAFATVHGVESGNTNWDDEKTVESIYYPEVEKVILDNVPTAKRVFLFDNTVRRSTPNARRAPVNRAHIDQTRKSAEARVHYHLPEEAEELLKGRYRIINVWRPLNGPVVANPLAFASSDSVADEFIVPVEHRYPHRTGETAGIRYTPTAKWHYLSGMTNDERLFLQCYDSDKGARVPHTAFVDPRTQEDWPGRDSIEVRALVFG